MWLQNITNAEHRGAITNASNMDTPVSRGDLGSPKKKRKPPQALICFDGRPVLLKKVKLTVTRAASEGPMVEVMHGAIEGEPST